MKTKSLLLITVCILIIAISLSGCVAGDGSGSIINPAGFFSGVWHGWIAPFALIYSFFNPTVGIYEIHNTGLPYNIGFYMAIISGFGGLALFRRKDKD